MKIFVEPNVYIIAQPQINKAEVARFFGDMDNFGMENATDAWLDDGRDFVDSKSVSGDLIGEFAGRICYGSFGKKQGRKSNKSYLEHIIGSGHGSILEHANYTFLVTQASRGYTHEMVRHRAGFAYSQESTHYVSYTPEDGRVCLDARSADLLKMDEVLKGFADAFENYDRIYSHFRSQCGLPKKEACSMARQWLPIGIEAKLVFTANLRALRHFIIARANSHNVLEIRKVAVKIFRVLQIVAPNSMFGLELIRESDGHKSVVASKTEFRKV
jgi:thymidylate synthase (FAD)